jgi:hypothetical protein
LFGLGVDFGVTVGGAQIGVAKPAPDDVDLDANLERWTAWCGGGYAG